MGRMTRLQQSKEFMRRVREIVLGHHEGEVMQITPVDADILVRYSRVRSLLDGVCVLLGRRLAAEAIILGRELFSDSLHLMEFASLGPSRASLVLGMVSQTLTEVENLERQALSHGVIDEKQLKTGLDILAKRRKKIEGYQRRHGISRLRRPRDEKQLARDHGRLDEYVDFKLAHLMVHRPDVAQAGRMLKTDDDVLGIHLRNPDDDFIAAVSAWIMASALQAHIAVASIFGWTEPSQDEIARLLTGINELGASGRTATPADPG